MGMTPNNIAYTIDTTFDNRMSTTHGAAKKLYARPKYSHINALSNALYSSSVPGRLPTGNNKRFMQVWDRGICSGKSFSK